MNEPKSLGAIESLCASLDRESSTLEGLTAALEADLEEVKSRHLRGLKRQASVVARLEAELIGAVECSPALFEKPKTLTIHGVKVGFANSQGRVEFEDEETVVAAIRKLMKDDLEVLLKIETTPRKDALRALTASELAKLGCRIVGAGDQVVVRRVAGDVEKLITKMTEKLVAKMVEAES